ncbi:hypothetical protein J3R83DRAFT_10626, partial [Lanmaoa asiatica]
FTSLDAKSIVYDRDGSTVYTFPNMVFIPEPHNADEELRVRADGRFGTADCFHWPQLYAEEVCYAICIRRKDHHPSPDPLSFAWYRPTRDDFKPLPHAAFLVSKLKQDKAAGIATLLKITSDQYNEWKKSCGEKVDIASHMLKSLEHDVLLLLNHPLTFHDLVVFVAQAQRYFLDLVAFLDYVSHVQHRITYPTTAHTPVRSDWMGCFTHSTKVCDDLFHAGVPVWLIRNNYTITEQTNIVKVVNFAFPDEIIRSMYSENGRSLPFPCLFNGPGGFTRHFHTRRHYVATKNLTPVAFQASSSQAASHVGSHPTRAQTRRVQHKKLTQTQSTGAKQNGGRDKWLEVREPEMPLSFNIWANAMQRVDKDPTRVKKNMVDQGYHVPEPALFVTCQSPERRKLFMTNWLAIRPLWYSRLDHDPPAQFPSPQEWREILHCIPSKDELEAAPSSSLGNKTAKGRKLAALEILGKVAASMTQDSLAPKDTVEWRGRYIPVSSLSNPPPRLIQAILWEIFEIGWRYELCALDQALNPQIWANHRTVRLSLIHAIFRGSAGLVLWSEPLPKVAGDLGLTDAWANNESVLRSFCFLLASWPDAHPSFSYIPSLDPASKQAQAYEVMSRVCMFYVQTFFDHFGRPPLLPHR